MYSQVNFPKKVTEKWLSQAFAPLRDYLNKEYPEDASRIMPYMTFQINENQRFYYRNSMTKGSIVLDQSGQLVSCNSQALQFDFRPRYRVLVERPPRQERFEHPNVTKWMSERLRAKHVVRFEEEVSIFLQEFWGPIVNYNFENLKVGYPLRGSHPPFCLYICPDDSGSRFAIQFVGDEIVEKSCSYAKYRKFQEKERELSYQGWHVVSVTREVLNEDPDDFHLYLFKVIGNFRR